MSNHTDRETARIYEFRPRARPAQAGLQPAPQSVVAFKPRRPLPIAVHAFDAWYHEAAMDEERGTAH